MKTDISKKLKIANFKIKKLYNFNSRLEIENSEIHGEIMDFISFQVENFCSENNLKNKTKTLKSKSIKRKSLKVSDIFKFPKKIRKLPNNKNNLNSQILKNEIVKVFPDFQKNNLVLVKTLDFAIGWSEISNFQKYKNEKEKNILEKKFLKKYENSKYQLGGKTVDFIDCSGLTQNYFLEIENILIPRNSFMQTQFEFSENFHDEKNLKKQDLIFMKLKKDDFAHIGIFFEKEKILHSSEEKNGIIFESFHSLKKRYKIINFSRINTNTNINNNFQ